MSWKRWGKYFISVRTEINVLLALCFISVFLIEFVFSNIPELFVGANRIGGIVERLCLSYISSYIFFFLVVHVKSQKDKENLYQYISKKTYRIINNAKSIISDFKKEASYQSENVYPTLDEVQKMCALINPHAQAPLILGNNYATWLQYLNYYKENTEENISKIYIKMNFLDSEYLKLIIGVQDCGFFDTIRLFKNREIKNTDLSAFAKEIYKYFEHVKLLEKYTDYKLKDYKDG
jgi:hypothetical protein